MILIDGDIIAYRCAASCEAEDKQEDLPDTIDGMVEDILSRCHTLLNGGKFRAFLTGSTNFRYEIATIAPYKGNRPKEKPLLLGEARDYLISHYDASVSDNQEADDDISIAATQLNHNCTIASIDKDFMQIPCWHYNWNNGQLFQQSELHARCFFYHQLLMGDAADNIKGVKGIGSVKATNILGSLTDEQDLYDTALTTYGGDKEALLENARLLWLRRHEGQMWLPPQEREEPHGQEVEG